MPQSNEIFTDTELFVPHSPLALGVDTENAPSSLTPGQNASTQSRARFTPLTFALPTSAKPACSDTSSSSPHQESIPGPLCLTNISDLGLTDRQAVEKDCTRLESVPTLYRDAHSRGCLRALLNRVSDRLDEDMADHKPSSLLLDLPLQLRNRVYAFALVEEGEVSVTPGVLQPALLRTCSQSRGEALPLCYMDTRFTINIPNCDGSLDIHWARHLRLLKHHGFSNIGAVTVGCIYSGRPNWRNLIVWLRAVYDDGEAQRAATPPHSSRYLRFVDAAHSMLNDYLDQP